MQILSVILLLAGIVAAKQDHQLHSTGIRSAYVNTFAHLDDVGVAYVDKICKRISPRISEANWDPHFWPNSFRISITYEKKWIPMNLYHGVLTGLHIVLRNGTQQTIIRGPPDLLRGRVQIGSKFSPLKANFQGVINTKSGDLKFDLTAKIPQIGLKFAAFNAAKILPLYFNFEYYDYDVYVRGLNSPELEEPIVKAFRKMVFKYLYRSYESALKVIFIKEMNKDPFIATIA